MKEFLRAFGLGLGISLPACGLIYWSHVHDHATPEDYEAKFKAKIDRQLKYLDEFWASKYQLQTGIYIPPEERLPLSIED